MSFRLVPKSVTLNYLERRNGVILRYFSELGQLPGALRKSSRSLSHLLMSYCFLSGRQRTGAVCGCNIIQLSQNVIFMFLHFDM